MKSSRSVYSLAAAATLAMAALGAGTAAQAGDVFWSVGVASPGVQVGVSNAPPVVVHQRPVIVYPQPQVVYAPPPVVYYPQPVYQQPQVVYQQPQVVYQQPYYTQAGWIYPGYRYGWDKHHGHDNRHGGWDRDEHGDRDDHRGRGPRS